MKLQYLCHSFSLIVTILLVGFSGPSVADDSPPAAAPLNAYPTIARVEYVNECIGKHDGKLAALYQCSCAIDRIANALNYDQYVEASTFAKYATLPGQGGSIFRDPESGKKQAKAYKQLEADSLRQCGLNS